MVPMQVKMGEDGVYKKKKQHMQKQTSQDCLHRPQRGHAGDQAAWPSQAIYAGSPAG